MARNHAALSAPSIEDPIRSSAGYFMQGLVTDLANPQTILFFASIFAATLTPATPAWVRILSWWGLVLTSIVWRVFLGFAFASKPARSFYERHRRAGELLAGATMAVFALKLLAEGLRN